VTVIAWVASASLAEALAQAGRYRVRPVLDSF
jgi:hypothetical protein